MGGEWAQLVALGRPGAGPAAGAGRDRAARRRGMAAQRPSTAALFAKTYERQDEMWLPIFFSPSRRASKPAGPT